MRSNTNDDYLDQEDSFLAKISTSKPKLSPRIPIDENDSVVKTIKNLPNYSFDKQSTKETMFLKQAPSPHEKRFMLPI